MITGFSMGVAGLGLHRERGLLWMIVAVVTFLVPLSFAMVISGETVRCSNEGENIYVPLVAADPCYRCFCRDGQVECETKKCHTLEGCHAILFNRPRKHCCDVCKGCIVGDLHMASGEVRRKADDLCIIIMCQAGVLTASKELCSPPCENPVSVPGQCCQSCSGCYYNGQTHTDGDTFYLGQDSDVQCVCKAGNVTCSRRACPVLNCPQEKIYTDRVGRCPQCKGQRKVFETKRSCFFAQRVFGNGDIHVHDNCTTCICAEGTMVCEREICPELTCPAKDQIKQPEMCCRTCRKWKSCVFEGITWKHTETWLTDKCVSCTCNDGTTYCKPQRCRPNAGFCVKNFGSGSKQGHCCSTCIKNYGTCTIRGKASNQIQTFDHMSYTTDGLCTHDLIKDCGQGHLSVRARYMKSADRGQQIDLVIFQFGSTRIKIYRNMKIRINRTSLFTNQFTSSDFSLRSHPSRVSVKAKLGLSVKWNLDDLLVIKINGSFLNSHRLCGLCGNFDGNKENELMNRKGRLVENSSLMARSWIRGKLCKQMSAQASHNSTSTPDLLVLHGGGELLRNSSAVNENQTGLLVNTQTVISERTVEHDVSDNNQTVISERTVEHYISNNNQTVISERTVEHDISNNNLTVTNEITVEHDMSNNSQTVEHDMSNNSQTVEHDMSNNSQTVEHDMSNNSQTVEHDMSNNSQTVEHDMSNNIQTVEHDMSNSSQTVEHDMSNNSQTVELDMSNNSQAVELVADKDHPVHVLRNDTSGSNNTVQ